MLSSVVSRHSKPVGKDQTPVSLTVVSQVCHDIVFKIESPTSKCVGTRELWWTCFVIYINFKFIESNPAQQNLLSGKQGGWSTCTAKRYEAAHFIAVVIW